jgi:hypothetical protein
MNLPQINQPNLPAVQQNPLNPTGNDVHKTSIKVLGEMYTQASDREEKEKILQKIGEVVSISSQIKLLTLSTSERDKTAEREMLLFLQLQSFHITPDVRTSIMLPFMRILEGFNDNGKSFFGWISGIFNHH